MSAANKPDKPRSGSKRGRKPETLEIKPEEADALLDHFLGKPKAEGEEEEPEEGKGDPEPDAKG